MTELAALEPGVPDTAANRLAARRARTNGALSAPQDDPGVSPPAAAPGSAGGDDVTPGPATCGQCGQTFTPGRQSGAPQVYCSPRCRERAAGERAKAKRAKAAGRPAPVARATRVAAEANGAEPAAPVEPAAEPAAPPPAEVPAVVVAEGEPPRLAEPDDLAQLVTQLVARGVDVELERGGWRLVAHPRT